MSLPVRGPWVVTPIASAVDWVVAAAALAATTAGTAAAVVITDPATPAPPQDNGAGPEVLREHVAALVELPASSDLDAVTAAVLDLSRAHQRVVVLVAGGVVTPIGAGGWTVPDLATAVRAPVVVVTGTGPETIGHTALALEALDRRRVPAAVIAVGDGGDFDALPVRLAGHIPTDHAATGAGFAAAAHEWIHPLDGSMAAAYGRPVATPGRQDTQTRVAIRIAWTLAVALLLAFLVLWMLQGTRYSDV